jgi:hypothetical protein
MSDKRVIRVQERLGFSGYLITLSEQPPPSAITEPATKPADAPPQDVPEKPER